MWMGRSLRAWRLKTAASALTLPEFTPRSCLVPCALIEHSFGDRKCTIEFVTGANGVRVRVTFDAESENPVEQQRQGWQAILNNFARHVEAH